jgi:hypothetical protein
LFTCYIHYQLTMDVTGLDSLARQVATSISDLVAKKTQLELRGGFFRSLPVGEVQAVLFGIQRAPGGVI